LGAAGLAAAVLLTGVAVPGRAGGAGRDAKAVSVAGPTGNAATIAFYRQVVAATRSMGGQEYSYPPSAPLMQVKLVPNPLVGAKKPSGPAESYRWLTDEPPAPGYAPAATEVYVGAVGGRVQFVAASVVYAGTGPVFPPFGLLLTAKGEVVLGGGGSAGTTAPRPGAVYQPCWGTATGYVDVGGYTRVGGASGYGLYGDFAAMRRVGATEVVTSTFTWSTSPLRKATEVDYIPVATHLPTSGAVHVAASAKTKAFTLRWTNKWTKTTLYPPNTDGACLSYVRGARLAGGGAARR